MTLTISIPSLPGKACQPNSRCHYQVKARAVRQLRYLSCSYGNLARPRHWTPAKRATIQATLWHKTNRRRDGDNALASLKAAFDGLVDAGILADDSGVTHLPVIFKTGTPKIELEVTVIE